MTWLPVVVLLVIAVAITVNLFRGGRWYTGGRSWADRDRDGRPVERTGNVSSPQWGGTTLDVRRAGPAVR